MSDDHGATRKTDRTSQELDSVRAMVAEMRRDIAALRAELGPDAAPMHVAPWPTAASPSFAGRAALSTTHDSSSSINSVARACPSEEPTTEL